MFNQTRNLKFISSMIFAVTFLVAGFFINTQVAFAGDCSVDGSLVAEFNQQMTNNPDSTSYDNNYWATDTNTRKIQIWKSTTSDTSYCGQTSDNGTFISNGTVSPNSPALLKNIIDGTFTGGATFSIVGTPKTTPSLTDTSWQLGNHYTDWIAEYFDSGYTYSWVDYTWTYTSSLGEKYVANISTNTGDIHSIVNSTTNIGYPNIQAAINAANDGDTINIAPGNYNIIKDDVTSVQGQTGWYLQISKNNITLQGVDSKGNPITNASNVATNIYSTQETPNGSWASQDLIAVFGNNVTIRGLGIMNKIEPNKGIEVMGNNFKAEYNKFSPVSVELFASAGNYNGDDITKYGSGVYFNNNRATEARIGTVVNNIFKNSGVTFDSFKDNWTVNVANNIFDGNRIWTSGNPIYYSSIGATTWDNQPNFTGSIINVNNNKFINMANDQVILKIKTDMTGTFNAVNNYWGNNPQFSSLVSAGVNYAPYFLDEAMNVPSTVITTLNTVYSTLLAAGIDNNLNVCSTTPTSCTGLFFEKSVDGVKMGRITFNTTLDLTSAETQTFLQNLGTKMDMAKDGIIGLDFTDATISNSLKGIAATIKFYNLDKLGFSGSSTATDINSKLVAMDESGNILDRSSLISATGVYTAPVGACEVGGDCYTFEIPVNHFTKYKILKDTQTAPSATTGAATSSTTTPEVVVTNHTQAVIVTVDTGTTNPTINVSSFIAGGTGTLPQITIDSSAADIAIPASTTVTSTDTTWNGVIAAPTITTVTLPETSGQTKTLSSAIEVGFTGAKLTFDKAVRILLPNQAGKRAGYVRTGTEFTEITNICTADSQTAGDALDVDSECKMDVGTDLVIWTKHFTTFAAYSQSAIQTRGGGGGGYYLASNIVAKTPVAVGKVLGASTGPDAVIIEGCGGRVVGFSVTTGKSCVGNYTATGKVLGASAFKFSKTLKKGSKSDAVKELQEKLRAEGYFTAASTNYFGDLTLKAVKAYQKAHKLPTTGLVGSMTIAELNK